MAANTTTSYRRVASLHDADELRSQARRGGFDLPVDAEVEPAPSGPLFEPFEVCGRVLDRRLATLPMEGWDGTPDGEPSDLTRRRWGRFGTSGAQLHWGCEAVAVRHDGRANPRQLTLNASTAAAIAEARQHLCDESRSRHGDGPLVVGLQLTHAGRFARPGPTEAHQPRTAYSSRVLDRLVGASPEDVMTDGELDDLVEDFVAAAALADEAGFDFVDVKHCHAYLGHELLGAVDRPGRYGGALENRMRFLREIVRGIQRDVPGLRVGVRLSAFDFAPFEVGREGRAVPVDAEHAPSAFGGDGTGQGIDLSAPSALLDELEALGVSMVCLTAGSPYYNPHIQRPAWFPPSDGYPPPEDPLLGVARQIHASATLKRQHPGMLVVGSGYSYLQEWLPNVAQAVVDRGMADFVGLGRMMLSYPELLADVAAGRPLSRPQVCRTFSDCTTSARLGLVSGCYPLDREFKDRPESTIVRQARGAHGP